MGDIISHKGVVSKAEHGIVTVKIDREMDCDACHAKGLCVTSRQNEKLIEVVDRTGNFHQGDSVELTGESSLGLRAVLVAFGIPLILIIAAVFIFVSMGWNETTSGLAGLSILFVYYLILYLLRNQLKKEFAFTLKKLNDQVI